MSEEGPPEGRISATPEGILIYEWMMLHRMRFPLAGIAEAEVARFAALVELRDPHEMAWLRQEHARRLYAEAAVIEAALAVLWRISATSGLPPASVMRHAVAGLRRAAERLAPGTVPPAPAAASRAVGGAMAA